MKKDKNKSNADEKDCECKCGCESETEKECTCEQDCNHNEGCDCGCEEHCDCKDDCDCNALDKKLAEEYLSLARQIQADFDNYRKRTTEQLENIRTDGKIEAIKIFLPVIDVLQKAITMVVDEKSNQGLKMVLDSLNNSLKEMGIEKLEVKGKPYSPDSAMAIASLNDNSMEDGIVIEEVTSGYKLKNKIVRYAQVVVNKIEK